MWSIDVGGLAHSLWVVFARFIDFGFTGLVRSATPSVRSCSFPTPSFSFLLSAFPNFYAYQPTKRTADVEELLWQDCPALTLLAGSPFNPIPAPWLSRLGRVCDHLYRS